MHATHLGARPRGPAAPKPIGLALALVLVSVPLAASATPISVPYTFSNGTVADANEVNANFGALVSESNAQDARLTTVETAADDHAADPSAHHTKTIDASELTAGTLSDARLGALVSLLGPSIDAGELAFDPATQAELDAHAGSPGAHHPRYSDAEAIAAVDAADGYVRNTGDTIGGVLLVTSGTGAVLQTLSGASFTPTDTWGIATNALGTATKRGGYFNAGSDISPGTAYGIEAQAHGTEVKYGGYFESGSPTTGGTAFGVRGVAHGDGTALVSAGSFLASSQGGSTLGIAGQSYNYGGGEQIAASLTAGEDEGCTGTAYGVRARAESSGPNYGGYFTAGTSSFPTGGPATGIQANAYATGSKVGGSFTAGSWATTGESTGVKAFAYSSDSPQTGGTFIAGDSSNPIAADTIGVFSIAQGSGPKWGGQFIAGDPNQPGTTYGIVGLANSSTGTKYGGSFTADTAGTGDSYGVRGWGATYDFYAAGPGVDYGVASSARWKRDVQPIEEPLEMVERLRGVRFTWDAEHGGERDVGMIAEEVGEVLPEIVQYEANGIDASGMDYSKLTPLLVEAVKALAQQNRELTDRLETLERASALAGFAARGGG